MKKERKRRRRRRERRKEKEEEKEKKRRKNNRKKKWKKKKGKKKRKRLKRRRRGEREGEAEGEYLFWDMNLRHNIIFDDFFLFRLHSLMLVWDEILIRKLMTQRIRCILKTFRGK